MIKNKVNELKLIPRTDLRNFQWDLKKHDNDESIENLAARINKKGFSAPIYVWTEENKILDWHQRLKALNILSERNITLKDDKVPVVYISAETEQEAKDTLLEYNTKYSDFNMEVLWEWAKDWDMEFLQIDELNQIQLEESDPEKEKIEDVVPAIKENIIVQRWDIFQLWEHRLMCGDSMNEEDIQKLLEWRNENVTHCISDPPYWIAYSPDSFDMIKNDDTILDYTWLAKKYTNWYFCMWTWYQVVDHWSQLIKNTFWKLTNMIIWHKGGGWMWDCARNLAQDFEILLVSNRDNKLATDYRWSATWYWNLEEKEDFIKTASKDELKSTLTKLTEWQSIWKVWKDNWIEYMHPTQKPVEINQRVIVNFTKRGDNILDLFWGSWSNLIACEKTRRKCYMMELDEIYVETILLRYYNYMKWEADIKCINRDLDLDLIFKRSLI